MAKTKVVRRLVVEDTGVLLPAWQQVGRYMYYFGHLELALGDLLHRSLRLSRRSAQLLLPRVMYPAKLDIIQAIIPMLNQPDSWKSEATRIVKDCRKFIDERNMFCHGAFSRKVDGTIRLDYINMKGKESAVGFSWSDDLFDERCKELEKLEREVSGLYPGFRPKQYILRAGSL